MKKILCMYKMPYYSLLLRFRNEEDIDYYIITGYYWYNLILTFNVLSIHLIIMAFSDISKLNLLSIISIYLFFAFINYLFFLKKGKDKLITKVINKKDSIHSIKFSLYYVLISFLIIVLTSIINNPTINRWIKDIFNIQ